MGDTRTLTISAQLRAARLARGLSIEQMAKDLNIRAIQLHALEEDRLQDLPPMAFTMGFVRAYARALGMDAEQTVHAFKVEHEMETISTELSFPKPIYSTGLNGRTLLVAGLLVTLALYLFFTFGSNGLQAKPQEQNDNLSVEEITVSANPPQSSVIDFTPTTTISRPATSDADTASLKKFPKPVNETLPIPKEAHQVIFLAHHDAWIEVRDSDHAVIFSGMLASGTCYSTAMVEGLTLTTSNAGAISIDLDGEILERLGADGAMTRNLPLRRDDLRNLAALATR